MRLPPEADPTFWVGAKCTRAHVCYFVRGTVTRRFTVVSVAAGLSTTIVQQGVQPSSAFSMQAYALGLARKMRTKGAVAAVKSMMPHIVQLDQQVAVRLAAADQRALVVFRRRQNRDGVRTEARRRERALAEIRRSAGLLTEEEVVTAWREGVVEGVHAL